MVALGDLKDLDALRALFQPKLLHDSLTHTGDAERALVVDPSGEELLVILTAQLGNTLRVLVIPCLHITVGEGNN